MVLLQGQAVFFGKVLYGRTDLLKCFSQQRLRLFPGDPVGIVAGLAGCPVTDVDMGRFFKFVFRKAFEILYRSTSASLARSSTPAASADTGTASPNRKWKM